MTTASLPCISNTNQRLEASYRTRNHPRNGDNGAIMATPEAITDRSFGWGKFTLIIDCDGLLTPDVNRPDIFISKSAEEAAQFFHLSTLSAVRTLYRVKIKCLHTLFVMHSGTRRMPLRTTESWHRCKMPVCGRNVFYCPG